jgi:hypothetical protein
MSRFNDDLHGISDSPEWRPYSSAQLIGKLGIRNQGLAEQRAAIAEWLADNEPTPKLLASLRADHLIARQHHSAA